MSFLTPRDAKIISETWPPDVVQRMTELRNQARTEMQGDSVSLRRFDYWLCLFDDFLEEAQVAWKKTGAVK